MTVLTQRERKIKRKLRKAEAFFKSGSLATLRDDQTGRVTQAWVIPMTRQQIESLSRSE